MEPPALPPTPPLEPPIISPQLPPSPQEKSPQGIFIVLALILITASFFAYKYYRLKQQIPVPPPSPSPTVTISPQPLVEPEDPTANWKTYENLIQNYSFKYPADWILDESGAAVDINNKLTLTKGGYIIAIYANIQGVSGVTRQVSSTPITLSGLNLFKRDIGDNFYAKTGSFEISATDSNPTFKYQDKIYEIYLTYPLADKETEAYSANLKTFDLILSTFKFNRSEPAQCLQVEDPCNPQACNYDQSKCSAVQVDCLQQGGIWQEWGTMPPREYCQIPASDAGKSCTDGSQCSLGKCLAINNISPGECQKFEVIFGCNKFIHNNIVSTGALCTD